MKKIFLVLLTMLMLVNITACSKKGPETTLTSTIDSIKKTESLITILPNFTEKSKLELTENASEELGEVDLDDLVFLDSLYKKLNPVLVKNLSYKIIDVTENENDAIINIEITNMDFEPVVADFIPDFFAYSVSAFLTKALSGNTEMTEAEEKENSEKFITEVSDMFLESINSIEDINLITKEVSVKMAKSEDGKWYIDDPEFIFYLLSNVQDSIDDKMGDLNSSFEFNEE